MEHTLYTNIAHAQRVTTAAQHGLANTTDVVTYTDRHGRIAPAILASSTMMLWSFRHRRALREQARRLVEVPCHQHDISIQTLGEYPLFTGLKLVRGNLSDVVIVPALDDPLVMRGNFPLPHKVHQRLRTMQRVGVPFDMLYTYIAHEVPRNSISADGPIPLAVVCPPAPAQIVRVSERLGVVADALTTTLLSLFGRVVLESVHAVATVGTSTSSAASRLFDPLIFGALADETGMATWFVLAQWTW